MSDLIRDAPFAQLVRLITRKRYFRYPEEMPDFVPCKEYEEGKASKETDDAHLDSQSDAVSERMIADEKPEGHDPENATMTSVASPTPGEPIKPSQLADGTVLADWYDTDDPANPQNWSLAKKSFVTFIICFYTTAVYMGSSIYTPSEAIVAEKFGVSLTVSSLGLALYVLAYGMGPMLWSPLSEIPAIGRNPPYVLTFAIFVILCVPTALVDNIAGLLVLRFLQGFFGSPCLATGGASLQDMFSITKVPYVMALWAFAATCGPALGPVISGFSVPAENWRWSLWELLWLSSAAFVIMFFFLPETGSPTILLQRAKRLREKTGKTNIKSQSELDQANMSVSAIAFESLWRPIQLMILDPSIAFTAIYISLIYGIYYSFFEAFPDVYINMYHFNVGEMGLVFLSIFVGVGIGICAFYAYNYWVIEPDFRKNGFATPPEKRLVPALYASFCFPVGLFLFAWTSNPSIHWIVSVIGVVIFSIGVVCVMLCIFVYLPFSYPQYAASLFAGNDLARSSLAFGAILFSRPLFTNLGIGPGVSLLAAFTAACIAGIFVLYFFGAKLRARSRFTPKY